MNATHPMERLLRAQGYAPVRRLPDGRWAGVIPMLTTAALCVGCDESGYRTRYCFETRAAAAAALAAWDGAGDPPGPWIKQKPEERFNPAWARSGP